MSNQITYNTRTQTLSSQGIEHDLFITVGGRRKNLKSLSPEQIEVISCLFIDMLETSEELLRNRLSNVKLKISYNKTPQNLNIRKVSTLTSTANKTNRIAKKVLFDSTEHSQPILLRQFEDTSNYYTRELQERTISYETAAKQITFQAIVKRVHYERTEGLYDNDDRYPITLRRAPYYYPEDLDDNDSVLSYNSSPSRGSTSPSRGSISSSSSLWGENSDLIEIMRSQQEGSGKRLIRTSSRLEEENIEAQTTFRQATTRVGPTTRVANVIRGR